MKINTFSIPCNCKKLAISVDVGLIATSIACQMNMHEIRRLLGKLHDEARENKDGKTLERLNRIFKYMELPLSLMDDMAFTFMNANEDDDNEQR